MSARNRELLALIPASLLLTLGFAAIFIQQSAVLTDLSLTYGAGFLALCLCGHIVIRFTLPYSGEAVTATVKSGWVTLEGEVEWHYQRERAEQTVRRIRGVKGVTNLIMIMPKVATTVVKSQIEDALRRSAETDAKSITVEVDGDKVILRGQVRSWAERQDAERAAWRAPGVREVQNLITIKV